MIPVPAGVRVWLASGVTDMRKGWSSLSLLVQEQMKLDPHGGHLFVFRGRQGGLIKVIWHDGQGACPADGGFSQGVDGASWTENCAGQQDHLNCRSAGLQ